MNVNAQFPVGTRVWRVGFRVSPKPTLPLHEPAPSCGLRRKVRDRERAVAPADAGRDACVPQK